MQPGKRTLICRYFDDVEANWIDESAVVTEIGSRLPRAEAVGKHDLWIPPANGGARCIRVLSALWPISLSC
jgi:hypothetical protein